MSGTWNVGVEPADLLHEPVVAEQLAVIRRHDDDRVVGLAGFVEPVEDAAELRRRPRLIIP